MPNPKVSIADGVTGDKATVTSGGLLKVDVAGATMSTGDIDVELSHTDDSVQLWGNESVGGAGTARAIVTDPQGHLQVDVLSGTGVAVTGSLKLQASDGTEITDSTQSGMLDVVIHSADGSSFADTGGALQVTAVDGAIITLGSKDDDKSAATDDTSITAMSVLKQISASVQETATDTGTIDTDTNNIATNTTNLNNCISTEAGSAPSHLMVVAGSNGGTVTSLECDSSGRLEVSLQTGGTGGSGSAMKADTDSYNENAVGISAKAVRGDTCANLTNVANGDWTSLQVNEHGALYISLDNISSDAGVIPTINQRAASAHNEKVTVGDSTTVITDQFTARFEVTIVNDSDEVIYLGFGEAAVLNEGVRLNPNGGSFSSDVFTESINGICASGESGNVTVLEIY